MGSKQPHRVYYLLDMFWAWPAWKQQRQGSPHGALSAQQAWQRVRRAGMPILSSSPHRRTDHRAWQPARCRRQSHCQGGGEGRVRCETGACRAADEPSSGQKPGSPSPVHLKHQVAFAPHQLDAAAKAAPAGRGRGVAPAGLAKQAVGGRSRASAERGGWPARLPLQQVMAYSRSST